MKEVTSHDIQVAANKTAEELHKEANELEGHSPTRQIAIMEAARSLLVFARHLSDIANK